MEGQWMRKKKGMRDKKRKEKDWEKKKRDKREKVNTQMFCTKKFGFFLEYLNYIEHLH